MTSRQIKGKVTAELVARIQEKKVQIIFDMLRKKFVTGEEEFSTDRVKELAEEITTDMHVVNMVVKKFGTKTPVKENHQLVGKGISIKTKGKVKVNAPSPEELAEKAEDQDEIVDGSILVAAANEERLTEMADEDSTTESGSK